MSKVIQKSDFMCVDMFIYVLCELTLCEEMCTLIKKGKMQAEREGKALIDLHLLILLKAMYMSVTFHLPIYQICIMDENGGGGEYQCGLEIADYYYSQVKSKLQKACMIGSGKECFEAIRFIVTMLNNNNEDIIPDLLVVEYEYRVKKVDAEVQRCHTRRYTEYIKESHMTKKEQRVLREWLDNPDMILMSLIIYHEICLCYNCVELLLRLYYECLVK